MEVQLTANKGTAFLGSVHLIEGDPFIEDWFNRGVTVFNLI